jgi:hypothetical protein
MPTDTKSGTVRAMSDRAAEHDAARSAALGASPAFGARSTFGAVDAAARKTPERRRFSVDLLGFDREIHARIRKDGRFASVFAKRSDKKLATADQTHKDVAEEEVARADILRLLSFGAPIDLSEARKLNESGFDDDDDDLDPPLHLMQGEARAIFDEVESLRAVVSIAQPLAASDKRLQAAVAAANEALAGKPSADQATSLIRQIETASGSLSLPPRYIASQTERILLEDRKFKKRVLFGKERFRVALGASSDALPAYIDTALLPAWPLLPAVPIVMLVELRPREDAAEAATEALFVRALGRVLSTRG